MTLKHQQFILASLLGISLIACSTNLETNALEEANPTNLETSDPVETEISLAATATWTGEKTIFSSDPTRYRYQVSKGITTDNQGNVIATGDVLFDGNGNSDPSIRRLLLGKLNPSGDKLWQVERSYPSTFDSSYQIATDSNRNIYVVGGVTGKIDGQNSNGLQDAFITKFSANGTVIWTRLIGAIGDDGATGVGVDSSNNVYVAGYACGSNRALGGKTIRGACDMFVTKFNPGGARQWLQLVGTDGLETANEMAVNPNGDIAIGGATTGAFPGKTRTGTQDAFAAKLNSSGTILWTHQFAGTTVPAGIAEAYISQVAMDSPGNVIVTGTTGGILGPTLNRVTTSFIRKLQNSNGSPIWTIADEPAYRADGYEIPTSIHALAVSLTGNIYAQRISQDGRTVGLLGYSATGNTITVPTIVPSFNPIRLLTIQGNDLFAIRGDAYIDITVAKFSLN
jgi:Beta-propeller repeat